MRRVLVALIVLFSVRVEGACPRPGNVVLNDAPKCQVVYKVPSSGEFAYQESYCKGDYPYCDQMFGDCCSEASYNEGLGGCCDSSTYVAHKVEDVSIKALNMFANNYKCCARGSYGNNSTYYFDAEGHAQCCGGEVYEAKSGSGKTCCNNEYNADGTVKRYYSTATVDGSPVGEVEKTCCVTKGDAPAGYKQTAYWNGGAQCCDGKTYKTGTDDTGTATYGCCVGSKGKNKTHKVVEDVLGAPNGEEACCSIESYGKSPTGYWNGSSAQCCKGKARKNGVDSDGQVKYACCEGDTAENPTQKKVSVLDAPNGEETCCDIATYGANPTAYWNGSSAVCCKGEAKKKTDGTYVCCPVVETCPDGSTPTPNHVDDVEGTCGSVCCKVKADYSDVYYDEWDEAYSESYSGWTIAGATNGKCCSGYTHFDVEGAGVESYITDDTWEIKNNNGGYYCANSSEGIEYWAGTDIDECYADVKSYYPNSSKVCYFRKWYCPEADPGDTVCCTSEKGEPGDICESSDVTF